MANTEEKEPLEARLSDALNSSNAEILSELAKDESCSVRFEVAKNPKTTEEILSVLANDKDWLIRLVVATVTKSNALLSMLAKDENSNVRERVVRNKNVTAEILTNLASDGSKTVRSAVAMVVAEIFATVVSKNFEIFQPVFSSRNILVSSIPIAEANLVEAYSLFLSLTIEAISPG